MKKNEVKCPKCGMKIPTNCISHGELDNDYKVVKKCDCIPIIGKIVKSEKYGNKVIYNSNPKN